MKRDEILVEQCVACGRVIRDDRQAIRDYHTQHYHWMPAGGEFMADSHEPIRLHATVCAEHLPYINFKSAREATPEKYKRWPSVSNATLPSYVSTKWLDAAYGDKVKLFDSKASSGEGEEAQ